MKKEGKEASLRYISLFSGGGGLDLGLEAAGFGTPSLFVEYDKACVSTLKRNRPNAKVFCGDLSVVSGTDILKRARLRRTPRLIVGGPPCQAFSTMGNRKGLADPRGRLVFHFARLMGEMKPDVFLMENVRGLLSMPLAPGLPKGSLLDALLGDFRSHGYRVDVFVVNAVNYGSPQIRERVFLIGNRRGLEARFSPPTHSNRPKDNLPSFRTLGDAIGPGFADPDPDLMNFSPRKLKYLEMVPPGGNWRSLPVEVQKESMGKAWGLKGGRSATWRRLHFSQPCPTVVTMPNHMSTSMCHPVETRALTAGECAAVQDFPSDWLFCGTTAEKYRQIGNAVPVGLATVAGRAVADLFARVDSDEAGDMAGGKVTHLRPHVRTTTYWRGGKVYSGGADYYATEEG